MNNSNNNNYIDELKTWGRVHQRGIIKEVFTHRKKMEPFEVMGASASDRDIIINAFIYAFYKYDGVNETVLNEYLINYTMDNRKKIKLIDSESVGTGGDILHIVQYNKGYYIINNDVGINGARLKRLEELKNNMGEIV